MSTRQQAGQWADRQVAGRRASRLQACTHPPARPSFCLSSRFSVVARTCTAARWRQHWLHTPQCCRQQSLGCPTHCWASWWQQRWCSSQGVRAVWCFVSWVSCGVAAVVIGAQDQECMVCVWGVLPLLPSPPQATTSHCLLGCCYCQHHPPLPGCCCFCR